MGRLLVLFCLFAAYVLLAKCFPRVMVAAVWFLLLVLFFVFLFFLRVIREIRGLFFLTRRFHVSILRFLIYFAVAVVLFERPKSTKKPPLRCRGGFCSS